MHAILRDSEFVQTHLKYANVWSYLTAVSETVVWLPLEL